MADQPILVVAGLLSKPHTNYHLIGKRADHLPNPGCWEYPGGSIERGESPQRTLQREWMKQLGVMVEVRGLLAKYAGQQMNVDLYEVEINWLWDGRLLPPVPSPGAVHSRMNWARPYDIIHLTNVMPYMGELSRALVRISER